MTKGGLQKRGKIWYAVYRHGGKQVWKSTCETRREAAEARMREIIAPINSSETARALRAAADQEDERRREDTGRTVRIADMWAMFERSPERSDSSPGTMAYYKTRFNRFAAWAAGHGISSVSDVGRDEARQFAAWLSGATGSPTYNLDITVTSMVWRIMCRETGWRDNPWASIAKKKYVKSGHRDLTVEEIGRLMSAAYGEYRSLFLIGWTTALRLADAATLKWCEVDLALGKIVRRPRKLARRTGIVVVIPILPDLRRELERLRSANPDADHVLPGIARAYDRSRFDVSYRIRQIFKKARIEQHPDAITEGRVRRTCRAGFHSLRHSFVSLCRSGGVPEAVVQEIVGHSSPAMTEHYTHIGDDAILAAAAAIPSLASPRASRPPIHEPLPRWARDELARMTDADWRETRDAMLAAPAPAARPAPPPYRPEAAPPDQLE